MANKCIGVIALWMLVFSFGLQASELPAPPNPPRLVNDFCGILSAARVASLEQKLEAFSRQTSTQIVVVTVPTLGDYSVSEYGQRLMDAWGVGQKGKNNGLVIVVKPKVKGTDRGAVGISTGYGLEGVVPDAVAKRIIEKEVLPSFRNGDVGGGIDRAVTVLMSLTRDEFTAEAYMQKTEKRVGSTVLTLLFLIVAFFLFYKGSSRRMGNTRQLNGSGDLPFWMLLTMMGSKPGAYDSFKGGNSGGGFGDSGGFGGGGFGGFGGGLGGGGGASGSW